VELWTIRKVLVWTTQKLERQSPVARLEAELLLCDALGWPRIKLYTDLDRPLDAAELTAYRTRVARRLQGEPVAYITGKREFWSLPLAVDPRVLIPRMDTEVLVEVALAALDQLGLPTPWVLDACTGSGAIALAIVSSRKQARVVATDRSAGALAVAQANVRSTGLPVALVRTDLVAGLRGPFDLVVSNPPYIRSGDLVGLQPEVLREPREALDGGPDGLDVYRRLIPMLVEVLKPGGRLCLEIGFDQAADVSALCRGAGLGEVTVTRDLARMDRVVSAQK
jgi:release factor glutamine methyltransferase